MLNETVPAEAEPTEVGDYDGDGTPDRMVKFPRGAVIDVLPGGDQVEVTVEGDVGVLAFAGRDTIRVLMPRVTSPNGEEILASGYESPVTWEAPADYAPTHYDIYYSANDGRTWNVIATGEEGTECSWLVPGILSDSCRVLIEAYDAKGLMGYDISDNVFTLCAGAGVHGDDVIPTRFALHPAVPNPFTSRTTIRFDLPRSCHVCLRIHDVQGRLVRELVNSARPAQSYSIDWDGRDQSGDAVGAGVYFVRMKTDAYESDGKVMLIR
jgi:hypothetical protein